MTDDKDILQALYAACVQAWAGLESAGRAAKVLINIRRVRLTNILIVASARFSHTT